MLELRVLKYLFTIRTKKKFLLKVRHPMNLSVERMAPESKRLLGGLRRWLAVFHKLRAQSESQLRQSEFRDNNTVLSQLIKRGRCFTPLSCGTTPPQPKSVIS